jgi:hypothetical protein
MQFVSSIFLFCFLMVGFVKAQTVDAQVCDILAAPQSFDGKIVRIKGTVIAGFEEFSIVGPGCNQKVNGIWLDYPENTKGKAGPAAIMQLQLARNNSAGAAGTNRSPVKLDKNKDFKQFDSLLSTPYKGSGMCLGCTRYRVKATLVGRLDGSKDTGLVRDSAGKFIGVNGFGNLNLYQARLVLQSVSDVTSEEIDYSKNNAATKDDSPHDSGGDPVAASHLAAKAFPPDSPQANQVERAAAAFGKEGEQNGVEVGFGSSNEVAGNEGGKGAHDSPDGLLFNCTFDMDRLKGDALARAIAHVGSHIADIRGGASTASLSGYELEDRAWQITVLGAIAFKQKTLTLPGSYLLWNAGWPADQRQQQFEDAKTKFLSEWVLISK